MLAFKLIEMNKIIVKEKKEILIVIFKNKQKKDFQK
jgi:hypothetical protein